MKYPGIKKLTDGRYLVRVKARCPKTGRMKEATKIVMTSAPSEAAAERERLRQRILGGNDPRSERTRLRTYARRWLLAREPGLKASTAHKYASHLEVHLLPELGDVFLDALEPTDVVAFRDMLAATLKPSTVNSVLRTFRTLLADAQSDLGLARNAASRVRALREARSEDNPNRLTADELARVLVELRKRSAKWHAFFFTLVCTGARFGEITALRWSDLDEAAGTLRIQRAQTRGVLADTKTGAARTLPYPPELATVLNEHRRLLVAEQASGLAGGWVFPSRVGGFHHPSSARIRFRAALAAAEITRHTTIHGLRRTFNNLARQVASGEVVRAIVGHTTEAMTEHYSHIEAHEKATAVAQVVRLVSPRSGS